MIDLFPVNKADFPEPVIVTGAGGCIGTGLSGAGVGRVCSSEGCRAE